MVKNGAPAKGVHYRRHLLAVVYAAVIATAGCSSPFSEFQSARMAGPGKIEVTGQFSAIGISGTTVQNQLGAQFGVGVTNAFDMRARYERIWLDDTDGEALEVFGFGPKISMHQDQTAFYLPVGFAFGRDVETSESWEAHPTILTTYSVSPGFEVNISMKAMLALANEDGFNTRVAVNMGFGIGPENLSYTFRPEVGVMLHTSGGDPFYHFGLGLSLSSTDKKRVPTS